jgi:glucose-6-phosphate 1-epimerase
MADFPRPESIAFHGMPAIRWRSRDGASAVATLQGAHLVSWIPAGGAECLYVSERSPFEAGRPIRGGIPIVFPQFADRGQLAQHGFARTRAWTFGDAVESEEGVRVSFALDSSAETRALWPHAFGLELAATIGGQRLDVELRVANRGDADFTFTAALHTYLRVSDAAAVRLHGLRGKRYLTRGEKVASVEARVAVGAEEPIDRVYFATPPATQLEDGGRTLVIGQRGFTDTVVWNPGRERTAQMADMPPDGYRRMLCVEAAAIEPAVVLLPGGAWSGGQDLKTGARPGPGPGLAPVSTSGAGA